MFYDQHNDLFVHKIKNVPDNELRSFGNRIVSNIARKYT